MKSFLFIVLVLLAGIPANSQTRMYEYDQDKNIVHSFPVETSFSSGNPRSSVYRNHIGKWSKDFTVPGISGTIYATATDGTNLYLGGNFKTAGNQVANSLIKWDGKSWSTIGEGLEAGVSGDAASVEALAFADGKLFVGGNFSKAGQLEANGIAFWDGQHWNTLGPDSINGLRRKIIFDQDTTIARGLVYELFSYNQKIYIGGYFHLAGDQKSNGIAAWDIPTKTWVTFDGGLSSNFENDPVYAYAFEAKGNEIYVGGKFNKAGGVTATHIARWDGSKWSAIGEAKSFIQDLELDDKGNLYAVGYYQSSDDPRASRIGKWDGSKWTSVSGPEGFNSYVTHIHSIGTKLYAAGNFNVNGYYAAGFAEWNGNAWQLIYGLGESVNEFFPADVFALQMVGEKLYLAGAFTKAGDIYPVNVVEWDYKSSQWKLLDDGHSHQGIHDGNIQVLESSGNSMYAGGSFTVAGGTYARNIARWTGSKWESLGKDVHNGIRGTVLCILADSQYIYAGGYFGSAGATEAFHIAKFDGTTWSSVGIGVGGVPGAHVKSLAKVGNYLYVGGYFSIVGDAENNALPANSLARFNLTTERWETLGRGIEYVFGIPGAVYDLEVYQDKIYVGGEFYSADDKYYENFAVLQNNKWAGIGENHEIGIEGSVRSIKVIQGEIYIGGILRLERKGESYGVLKWDGKKWIGVGGRLSAAGRDVYVNQIEAWQQGFIAAGYFLNAGNLPVNHIAYYDGTNWQDLEGGIKPGNIKFTVFKNKLYAAGPFELVAGGALGIGILPYQLDVSTAVSSPDGPDQKIVIKIYPNPAHQYIIVEYKLPVHIPSAKLDLFDAVGSHLKTYDLTVTRESMVIPVTDLPAGFYFYKVRSVHAVSGNQKIIVVR